MASRTFACTQCGACCNRPPEVELGEAAPLADVFAWQLLLRLYSLPKVPDAAGSAEFYERKRLLSRFAAYSYDAKALVAGRKQPRTVYLTISALALDLQSGSCPALGEARCTIYPRRPLTCCSVPLHYSHPEAAAIGDLDAFTATAGHACDTAETAPLILQEGRIVSPALIAARAAAAQQADADRAWKEALVKAIKTGRYGLPSLALIEQNAARGALSVPMATAWRVAHDAGLIGTEAANGALAAQGSLLSSMAQLPDLPLPVVQAIAELRKACTQPL